MSYTGDMTKVEDILFKVNRRYLIGGYKQGQGTCNNCIEEWSCKEVTPNGAAKFINNISKKVFWLKPYDMVEISEILHDV